MTLTSSSGGCLGEDRGVPVLEELLLDWLDPFLTEVKQVWLLGWNLVVSL